MNSPGFREQQNHRRDEFFFASGIVALFEHDKYT